MDISELNHEELNQFKSIIIDCGLMIECSNKYATRNYRHYLAEKCLLLTNKLGSILQQLIDYTDELFDDVVCKVIY